MHILLTNDDGVFAPGLAALAQALNRLGEVTVLAPDRNWSAAGHVKTMHRPLRVWESKLASGEPALATDGSPADCIALAVLGLVQDPIDLVVSGINPFPNLGQDVTYSGTVTAAMEAIINGLPGIAFSLDAGEEKVQELAFESAAAHALQLTRQIMSKGLPNGIFLNVNIPYRPVGQLRGVRITHQGQRVYRDALVVREDPRGRTYYWIGGDSPTGVRDPDTDFRALAEDYISITPLQLDLTAYNVKAELEGWNLGAS